MQYLFRYKCYRSSQPLSCQAQPSPANQGSSTVFKPWKENIQILSFCRCSLPLQSHQGWTISQAGGGPGGRSLEKVGSPTSFCTESEFSLFFYGISYIFLRIAWTANIHGPTFGIKILWSIKIKPNRSYTSFLHYPIYLTIRFEMKEALWKKINYVSKILILLQ